MRILDLEGMREAEETLKAKSHTYIVHLYKIIDSCKTKEQLSTLPEYYIQLRAILRNNSMRYKTTIINKELYTLDCESIIASFTKLFWNHYINKVKSL